MTAPYDSEGRYFQDDPAPAAAAAEHSGSYAPQEPFGAHARACLHFDCPGHECLGEGPALIDRVRVLGARRRRQTAAR